MNRRLGIEIHGIVQGVGFRPYIYRLAHRFHLTGRIHNSESGVSIEVQGLREDTNAFLHALPLEAPPLARLDEIQILELALAEESEFVIRESTRSDSANTLISPDIATCEDCVLEMLDSADRRYRYPFTNCTNCGPRFTITRSVPYDRGQTSMSTFKMCVRCQGEYDDPLDRRFHTQPNACWDCGPQVELVDRHGVRQSGEPIAEAVRLLHKGHILAIKGLGGFHLAVDASRERAVQELRRRKNRGEKPFAIMVDSIATARNLCQVSEAEERLLKSPQRPIVLLTKRSGEFDALAPDGNQLGIFLPYTPIHFLLFAHGGSSALVMTSGNLSEEPIAIDNSEAMARLGDIADYFMLHNRDILLRCDDSVVKHLSGSTQFARRSRGFVPAPIRLREPLPPILAVGGELKNAICIARGRYAFVGQHVGDLENLSAYDFFQESIHHFQEILEVRPEIIAHDLHPGYLATQWARRQADLRLVGVQHHHAHVASCMAENHLTDPVIGIALDGTGYGTDGQVWGGEILIADFKSFERAGHLDYVGMPGGDQAIHEPWRMAVSYLWSAFGEEWRDHAPAKLLGNVEPVKIKFVEQLLRAGRLPGTSSCGRLFDAVAALALDRSQVTYEAQSAIALEACCDSKSDHGAYPFAVIKSDPKCLRMDTRPLFTAIADDVRNRTAPEVISGRFHAGLIQTLAETSGHIAQRTGLRQVCLSGGSFQNAILAQGLEGRLIGAGLQVYKQTQVPPGDGGLSLGQLLIAANSI